MQLPYDLAIDLWAFSEANMRTTDAEVVRQALRHFIKARLDAEPATRQRFMEAKASLRQGAAEKLRVIDSKPATGADPQGS